MNIKGTILITQQACYDARLKELEVDANRWVNFAVDMLDITAIKEISSDDEGMNLGEIFTCSGIYLKNGANFVVIEDFKELLSAWEELMDNYYGSHNHFTGLN